MQDIKNSTINPRSLSSILNISLLICLFVAFILGAVKAESMVQYNPNQTWSLVWAICAPYLVFMILSLILGLVKFVLCTLPLKKDYSMKDTINAQFWMEIILLVVILLGCISLAFISHDYELGGNARATAGPIIISTLAFALGVACSGLAYHNYK